MPMGLLLNSFPEKINPYPERVIYVCRFKATFGKNSSIVKWIVLAEVLVGAVMYMMTKNIKFLVGFAILSVFIAVGMSVAGF